MDADKQRRLITETETLSLLESTGPELQAADEILVPVGGVLLDGLLQAGTFVKLVKHDQLKSATLAIEGEPACVLFYSTNGLGWLTIEGAAALKPSPLKTIFRGVDALAKHLSAPVVVLVTRFAALMRAATSAGYKPGGVILMKGAYVEC
ncbi:MAG: hypothetical protein ABSA45_03190 [Verrucomicrobiota bacterium]